jgi:ABC-type multidrug transport system fused ATPase/permease subunit
VIRTFFIDADAERTTAVNDPELTTISTTLPESSDKNVENGQPSDSGCSCHCNTGTVITTTVLVVVLVSILVFFAVIVAIIVIVMCFVLMKYKQKVLDLQEHVYDSVSVPADASTQALVSKSTKLTDDDEAKEPSISQKKFELTDNVAYGSHKPLSAAETAPNTH